MHHWQSALRLLVVTLALLGAPAAIAQLDDEPTATSDVFEVGEEVDVDLTDEAVVVKPERHDPTDWLDWRSYTPSATLGYGVTFDNAKSALSGNMQVLQSTSCSNGPDICVDLSSTNNQGFSGGAFDAGGRLMLPEFDVASRPRLFVGITYTGQVQNKKFLANQGPPVEIWEEDGNTLKQWSRVDQTVDPNYLLYAGFGASFKLPIDAYPVRITTSMNYFQASITVGANSAYQDAKTGVAFRSDHFISESQDLLSHGIAPSIGLDVEVDRVGPIAVGFFSEFLLGIPLTNTSFKTHIDNGVDRFPDPPFTPNPNPENRGVDYSFERELNYNLGVGIRFSWVGY